MEPESGTKPSEIIKIRDINIDKLETKDVKGTVTNRGPKDAQAASSSSQSACEPLNKTKPLKKQVPGRGDFCYYSNNYWQFVIVSFWYTLVVYQVSLIEPWFVFWQDIVKQKYLWRDQTNLICCWSILLG